MNSFFSPLQTRAVPKEHPRLFGPRSRLQFLARLKPEAYRRTRAIALAPLSAPTAPGSDFSIDFGAFVGVHAKMWSLALCAAVEEDAALGREAVAMAFAHFIDKPVKVGHDLFGGDVGEVAIVYDFCHEHWSDEQRRRYHAYLFECRDRNVDEELGPFHDGWWGYKNWGFVLGLLATMYETEKEPFLLYSIDREFRTVAADCLRLAGDGGGYAEGFYVNYYLYPWLLACEAMRACTGVDWCLEVPEFYRNRAVTQMFETFPTIRERGSRRSICIGDGRGRVFKAERDATLAATRILVDRFRDDPEHQAVAAWMAATPRMGADEHAYRDVLFGDPAVPRRDLARFRLSHVSPGPGFAYARSSWGEDATHFFLKCGKRVTAHQHLDVGHFGIFRHEELIGESGHYCDFGGGVGGHDPNFHLRTIAHNSLLVHDPDEVFSFIRGAPSPIGNDGGQRYPWPGTCFRHNGDAMDGDAWRRHPELGDVGRLTSFHDAGAWLYLAGDCTKAYAAAKLALFTRQVVYLRPGAFVIFDRVTSTRAGFRKTWLLHAMKPPTTSGEDLVVTNGRGRLFVQTVLPARVERRLNLGDDLYRYGGGHYPPRFKTGPEAECRIEVSPTAARTDDLFLHVLTATDADVASVARASVRIEGPVVTLTLGDAVLTLHADRDGGAIHVGGASGELSAGLPPTRR